MNLRHTLSAALSSLALLLGAAGARASLIDDDFESYTTNLPPAGGWTSAGDTSLVSTDQSVMGDPGDSQGLRLTDSDPSAGEPKSLRSFTSAATTIYVQFDYKFQQDVANAAFQLRGGSASIGVALHLTHFSTNSPAYNEGSGYNILSSTVLNAGDWYRFTVTADAATDQFDLRIQSLLGTSVDDTYNDLGLLNDQTGFNDIRFLHNNTLSNSKFFAVDNVLVTDDPSDLNFSVAVPEPATAVLLLGGCLLFLARSVRTFRT